MMTIKKIVGEINGSEITLTRQPDNRIEARVSNPDKLFCHIYEISDEESAFEAANQVLLQVLGGRKRDKAYADCSNSDMHDFTQVLYSLS